MELTHAGLVTLQLARSADEPAATASAGAGPAPQPVSAPAAPPDALFEPAEDVPTVQVTEQWVLEGRPQEASRGLDDVEAAVDAGDVPDLSIQGRASVVRTQEGDRRRTWRTTFVARRIGALEEE